MVHLAIVATCLGRVGSGLLASGKVEQGDCSNRDHAIHYRQSSSFGSDATEKEQQ
ncbi:MAG: hypothetical protein ABI365_04060 [Lysobacteraceae bacterium]